MFVANCTRPDIAFVVNYKLDIAQLQTKRHWIGVKNIFIYLQGTTNLGLFYQFDQDRSIVGYTDVGHPSDPHDARS